MVIRGWHRVCIVKRTMTYKEFIGYVPAHPRLAAFLVLEPRMEARVEVREWKRRRDMLKHIEEHDKCQVGNGWRPTWITYTRR